MQRISISIALIKWDGSVGFEKFIKQRRKAWKTFDESLVKHVRNSVGLLRSLRIDIFVLKVERVARTEEDRVHLDVPDIPRTCSACEDANIFLAIDKFIK